MTDDNRAVASSSFVLPWTGKLRHSRDLCDDWGCIRDESGRRIFTVTVPPSADPSGWEQYRRNGTDPTQPIVDALLAILNGQNATAQTPPDSGTKNHG